MEEEESGGGGGGGDAPAWMATFADLMSLLLTFFILLLSFANMDIVKFRDMLGSMKDAFGYQKEFEGNFNPEDLTVDDVESQKDSKSGGEGGGDGKAMDKALAKKIENVVEDQELEHAVEVEATQRGVVIRVKDQMIFSAGAAKLTGAAPEFLSEIARLLNTFPYAVLIEGHTDNRPIRSRRYPSNWELSTSRAITVLRFLSEKGKIDVSRLGVAGYADTRPIASNKTADGRVTNRRVEFVCYKDVALAQKGLVKDEEENEDKVDEQPRKKSGKKGRRRGKRRRKKQ